jgi:hypothetical protein
MLYGGVDWALRHTTTRVLLAALAWLLADFRQGQLPDSARGGHPQWGQQ